MMPRGVSLHPHEELLAVVRRSILPELYRMVFGIVWTLLPFFFFFPLVKAGVTGMIFFLIIFLSGLLFFLRQWWVWRFTALVVTNTRVVDIDQHGLRRRTIHEIPLEHVKRVRLFKDSWLGALFGLRTMRIESAPLQRFDIEFSGMPQAKHVKELIVEVQSLRTNPPR